MSDPSISQRELTIEQYLELEREAPIRHDRVGGFRHPTAETSPRHDRIVENVYRALVDAAEWLAENAEDKGPPCRISTRTVNLRVPKGDIYYPDVMVVCDAEPEEYGMEHAPCLLVEVMTPGVETIDQFEKWGAYNHIPTLKMYLVVDPDRRRVERFIRATNTGNWLFAVDGGDGEFRIPCPRSYLKLDWIYEGL